jgi:hypothetical protein
VLEKLARFRELLDQLESAANAPTDEAQLLIAALRQHFAELEAMIRTMLGA